MGQGLKKRADDVPVDLLQRLHLFLGLPLVGGFVRRLNMDADDVVIFQCCHAITSLGGIVGIQITGRSGNVDALPAQKNSHPAHEVHGTKDGPPLAVNTFKGIELRRFSLAPEPYLRGGPEAARGACQVDGVSAEEVPAAFHEVAQQVAPGPLGKMIGDWAVRDVMGRLRRRLVPKRRIAAAIDEDVAITDARVKFQSALEPELRRHDAAELLLDGFHQGGAVLGGNVPGGEVAHLFPVHVDQVAAHRPVAWPQLQAHRGRFQWGSTGIYVERIIAKEAQRGDVAGRGEAGWNIVATPDHAGPSDAVHVRFLRSLQRRLAAEAFLGLVGTTVGNDNSVFHGRYSPGRTAVEPPGPD